MRWTVLTAVICVFPGCLREPLTGGGGASGTTGPVGTTSTTTSATTAPPSTSANPSTSSSTTSSTGDPPNPTTATVTSGSTTTGCAFLGCGDYGDGSIECDQWAQDCPSGEKCMPWANDGGNSWNATKCTPVDPDPGGLYEPCTVEGNGVSGVDDCEVGMMCWDVDPETMMGFCVGLCVGSEAQPDCVDPKASCIIYSDGVLTLCLPGCDPLLQDCFNPADLCIANPSGDGFVCVLDASGDEGQYGDPCEYANACDHGLFCANASVVPGCAGALGCCAEFCDVTDPLGDDQCPGMAEGEACVPWYEMGMAPMGLEHVGACVIPF